MNRSIPENGYHLTFCLDDVFISQACIQFANAWDNWRAGRLLPSRADIDLNDVSDLMPRMTIVEVQSNEVALMRLMGTDFQDHFGQEVTGLNLIELTNMEARHIRGYRLMTMSRKLCGSRTYAKTIGTSGKVTIGEVVIFPIKAHEAGNPAHLIAYSHMLQHDYIPAEEADKVVIPNSDEFCFLDIGVGIAATNPE